MFYLMKILLIDDNKEITSMLSKFLNYKGHQIVVSNDAMEGLSNIKKEEYDVILLDINMPIISGFNFIDILATDETLKDQNIFIFSAQSFHDIHIKNLLRKDGVNGVLKKPMKLDEILTAITS